MFYVDLNCDLGEGFETDAALMRYISSANIACGAHAGDMDTMKMTVDLAIEHGVAIGAHPGYPDRENFGRTAKDLPLSDVSSIVTEQIISLANIAEAAGAKLSHVKPHGALYNQSARDRDLATEIANAVREIDDSLILYGLSGSRSIDAATQCGLVSASEVFADRTYLNDGSLTPRSEPNAIIDDREIAINQALDMVKYGRVKTIESIMIHIRVDTICLHGDGEHAVDFASYLRQRFDESGIGVRSING